MILNFKSEIVTSFKENCYIIWSSNNRNAILCDPGGDPKKIENSVKKLNVLIKKIIITHGHIDHVGAAFILSKLYKVPILGPHIFDNFLIENLSHQSYMFNVFPEIKSFKPNVWVNDGDIIKLDSHEFKVIHCPGHSPGHVAFWNKNQNILLSGDILFNNGIGRIDLPGGDKNKIIGSIKNKILKLCKKNIMLLPGHGESFFVNPKNINVLLKNL
ncbi:ycbL [Wigglesworthia glossinidia endosymbiont of Glossina brevipalpis]|uniref:YcbL protein n=1 Tax=Wigglesworthia glossinidia brevipalpis TaxID=36870 RepID=Q8D376_WIGBR|nr:ycbL [Wigglesworthia glossinidia endosymbiont of Glossina brevipalpis]